MPFEFDPSELGIELSEEQSAQLKEKLSAKYQESVDAEVGGLKAKRDELLEYQRKMKDQLKQYDGIDPERARKLEQTLAENEEARLIAEGKIEEVMASRTERMRNESAKQVEEARREAEAARGFAEKFRSRVLSDEVRTVASKLGDLAETASDDAFLRAQSLFEVNDEGVVVPKESAGLDADGKPLTVQSWLASMRESAPHWFLRPQGSGAPGSNSSSASPRAWKDAQTTADKVEILKRKQRGNS